MFLPSKACITQPLPYMRISPDMHSHDQQNRLAIHLEQCRKDIAFILGKHATPSNCKFKFSPDIDNVFFDQPNTTGFLSYILANYNQKLQEAQIEKIIRNLFLIADRWKHLFNNQQNEEEEEYDICRMINWVLGQNKSAREKSKPLIIMIKQNISEKYKFSVCDVIKFLLDSSEENTTTKFTFFTNNMPQTGGNSIQIVLNQIGYRLFIMHVCVCYKLKYV